MSLFVMLKYPAISISGALLLLTSSPETLNVSWLTDASLVANAQSSFTFPADVPGDTVLKIEGSGNMTQLNQALKTEFETAYPDSQVELLTSDSKTAIARLAAGEVDLAAIARPLTPEEEALGLESVVVNRDKMAIIVGADNPFTGDLSFDQFAQIFRGEITDWSELGGEPGAIRFVDRPDGSNLRLSLKNYSVFQKAPFETGDNAVRLDEDDMAAVVTALNSNGISYASADQIADLDAVKVVSMHQVLPNDPLYPYSQPRTYVYRAGDEAAKTLAFLGLATSPTGQAAIATAKTEEAEVIEEAVAVATPEALSEPTDAVDELDVATDDADNDLDAAASSDDIAVATDGDNGGAFPWWLLLLLTLPLIGLFLAALLRRDRTTPPVVATPPSRATAPPPVPPATPVPPGVSSGAAAGLAVAGLTAADDTPPVTPPPTPVNEAVEPNPPTSNRPGGLAAGAGLAVGAGLAAAAAQKSDSVTTEPLEPVENNVEPTQFPSEPDAKLGGLGAAGLAAGAAGAGLATAAQTSAVDASPEPMTPPAPAPEAAQEIPAVAPLPPRPVAPEAVAVSLGAAALSSELGDSPADPAAIVAGTEVLPDDGDVQYLSVDNRRHCFLLPMERMEALQNTAASESLAPGTYVIRIKEGGFNNDAPRSGEQPMVMLWIYGGLVVNQKTQRPVLATWSSLNGYQDSLTLTVIEPCTLNALFFDSYVEDNTGEVTLSISQLST